MRARLGRILLAALALLGSLSAARAQTCQTLPPATTISPVTVAITATDTGRPHRARIRGMLQAPETLSEAQLRQITRTGLCHAAVGEMVIDDSGLCATFGDAYGSLDRVERAGTRISFDISADVPRRRGSEYIDILVFRSPLRCAPQATFVIGGSGDQEIASVPFLADRLADGTISWTETQWGPDTVRELAIGVRERRGEARGDAEGAEEPTLTPPRSWTAYARGEIFDRLLEFLWVPVWVLVILAGFMIFGGALLYADADPPLAALVRALTAAVALYVAARWTGTALDLARLLGNAAASGAGGWPAQAMEAAALELGHESSRAGAAALFMLPLALLLWTISLVAPPRPGYNFFRHALRLALRSLAVGSLVGVAFLALVAMAGLVLPIETPFEPLALAVSLFLAFWAVNAFAPVTEFSRSRAALAALAVTLLLLYPHPVIHGSGEPPSAIDNALVWFAYAGGYFVPNAMLLTVALVAALKIARSKSPRNKLVEFDRTLLFLFGFSVTLVSIGSLTSAMLLFAVLAGADRLLFPRGARPSPGPKPRRIREARLALGVATIAAAVFWIQYSGDLFQRQSGPPSLLLPAMLLYSAAVPAAIGGLLLQHSFERLPGPIASAKALVITAFAFAASVATRLPFILEQRSILPAVTGVLGIFTALLATAIVLYDGPEARGKLGGNTLKERLGEGGFGWFLTVLSSAALAAASALSPVLFDELGNAFRSVVRGTLGSDAAAQAGSEPAAPPPRQ